MELDPPGQNRLEISRRFAAPRDLVFQTWTDPQHLAHWWGPAGMQVIVEAFDLRPGGTFLYSMAPPNGEKFYGKFVYAAIEAPHRLDFIVSFCDAEGTPMHHPMAPLWPLEVMNEVRLEAVGDETLMTVVAYPHRASAEESAFFGQFLDNVRGGSEATYKQLDAYLAALPASASDREILVTRVFDAPRQLVWRALTEPAMLQRWWAPSIFTTPFISVDLRIGGQFRYCMRSPEGQDFWGCGVYTEIVPEARLAYLDNFTDADGNTVPPSYYGMQLTTIEESRVEIDLADRDGKTEMVIRYISHAEIGAERAMAEQGWNEMVDRLARVFQQG